MLDVAVRVGKISAPVIETDPVDVFNTSLFPYDDRVGIEEIFKMFNAVPTAIPASGKVVNVGNTVSRNGA